ncbi:uncharacterized protein KY384_004938 [Bacidia gigantensis]|uniref:uncharacterized protein n=1 Tax=Bacidia gigantensis TaxID=2732470 RepID=UPI001D03A6B3|nr:uncharacterized protein KY384_004938 [Bacidia gigantensis]KAG8530436.1 hypothetical protein KY384_004938 [Bacidia gigantensis]
MSLNGLDSPDINQTYLAALNEGGCWYSSRDEVQLYEKGPGGVKEAQGAVKRYEEDSPLYGFILYRRRKVLLKYVPEGTSRLLQARVSVHFQAVEDKFTPHDAVYAFASAGELEDTALSSEIALHTAASIRSITESHLSGITEDDGDTRSEATQKPKSVADQSGNIGSSRTADDDAQTRHEKATEIIKAMRKQDSSPSSETKRSRAPSDPNKALPNAPNHFSRDQSKPQSVYNFDPRPSISSVDGRMSSQSARPSTRDLANAYEYKGKIRFGPRPSVESVSRPSTAGASGSFRPVAALPVGLRMPLRNAAPLRPNLQQQNTPFATTPSPRIPLPTLPSVAPRSLGSNLNGVSIQKKPSEMAAAMTPEKKRLMKALELRNKQLAARRDASSHQGHPAPASKEAKLAEEQRINLPAETLKNEQIDPSLQSSFVIEDDQETVTQRSQTVEGSLRDQQDSPVSGPELSEGHSTQASSIIEEDTPSPKKSHTSEETIVDEKSERGSAGQTPNDMSMAPEKVCDILPASRQQSTGFQGPESVMSPVQDNHEPIPVEYQQDSDHSVGITRKHAPISLAKVKEVDDTEPSLRQDYSSKEINDSDSDHSNSENLALATSTSSSRRAVGEAGAKLSPGGQNQIGASSPVMAKDPGVRSTSESHDLVPEGQAIAKRSDSDSQPSRSFPSSDAQNEHETLVSNALNASWFNEADTELGLGEPEEIDVSRADKAESNQPSQELFATGVDRGFIDFGKAEESNQPVPGPTQSLHQVSASKATKFGIEKQSEETNASSTKIFTNDSAAEADKLSNTSESTSITQAKRRGASPLKRTSTPDQSDEHFLSDDSFMEELKTASVQEAKPISVSKSPIKPVFARHSSETKALEKPKAFRSISSPMQIQVQPGRSPSPPPLPTLASPRSFSASNPPLLSTHSKGAVPPKKYGVSTSISARIKALEQMSSRPTSPTLLTTPQTTFISLSDRKSSLQSSPQTPDITAFSANSSRPSTTPQSPSTSPQLASFSTMGASVKGRSDSISVTATIVRDVTDRLADNYPNSLDSRHLDLHRSPLLVEHSPMSPPSFHPLQPPRPQYARQASARSGSSSNSEQRKDMSPKVSRRESFASWRSGSSRNGSDVDLPRSASDKSLGAPVDGFREEKRDSKGKRLLKRMSNISSVSKRSLASALNSSPKEAAIIEHRESIDQPSSSTVDLGDINVQFPDTLLWKRRHMVLNEQGVLSLHPSTLERNPKIIMKSFSLAEFRPPYIPDQDRQELPNSIIFDFKNGSTLQCACDTRKGQIEAYNSLRQAHSIHVS